MFALFATTLHVEVQVCEVKFGTKEMEQAALWEASSSDFNLLKKSFKYHH